MSYQVMMWSIHELYFLKIQNGGCDLLLQLWFYLSISFPRDVTIVFYIKIRIQWYITLHVWPRGLFGNWVQRIGWRVNLEICVLQKRTQRTQNVRKTYATCVKTCSFDLPMWGHVLLFTFIQILVEFDWSNGKVVRYSKLSR